MVAGQLVQCRQQDINICLIIEMGRQDAGGVVVMDDVHVDVYSSQAAACGAGLLRGDGEAGQGGRVLPGQGCEQAQVGPWRGA